MSETDRQTDGRGKEKEREKVCKYVHYRFPFGFFLIINGRIYIKRIYTKKMFVTEVGSVDKNKFSVTTFYTFLKINIALNVCGSLNISNTRSHLEDPP